jgi:crotonobetainyl-CoA:carnitine CoA-transferase CaiB-like acyl-CoA transferase
VLAGPWAAQTLADLGADVIKVEHPDLPDETRTWGPPFWHQHSTYYLSCNRGKRALSLDLKHPEGRTVLDRLLRGSDIVIENFRTSSLDEIGMKSARLHQVNPQLVICSISGFGRTGPLADVPGYDFVIQGLSGMMAKNGPKDGDPCKFGVAIADLMTGQTVTVAALAGLQYRRQYGHGIHADIALADCAVAGMANVVQAFLATGQEPARQGNEHMQIVPYQAFQTTDGWIIVAVGNDRQWRSYCAAIERPDLAADPELATNEMRVRHRERLTKDLTAHMVTQTTAWWLERLQNSHVPAGKVQTFGELFSSPLAAERRYRVQFRDNAGHEVDLMSSPLVGQDVAKIFPPDPGAHSDEILGDVAGCSAAEIAHLRDLGVVR